MVVNNTTFRYQSQIQYKKQQEFIKFSIYSSIKGIKTKNDKKHIEIDAQINVFI